MQDIQLKYIPVRVINAIKDLDSKEMLKLGFNKKEKILRNLLLPLLKLADIIVFSDAFFLFSSVGCQFRRGKMMQKICLSGPSSILYREKHWKCKLQWELVALWGSWGTPSGPLRFLFQLSFHSSVLSCILPPPLKSVGTVHFTL